MDILIKFVLENIKQDSVLINTRITEYKFYKYPKHLTSFFIPLDGPVTSTVWEDALGKHLFQLVAGSMDWTTDNPFIVFSYINAEHGPLWGCNYY